jgi:hypothetical protein
MTAALGNTAQGTPFATGVDAYVYPQFIGYAQRAPTTQDIYPAGTKWQNNAVNPAVIYITTGSGLWYSIAGAGASLTSLTVNGPTTLTGTTNINTTGAAATSIGTGGTGVVNIGNATGGTVVTGPESVSGILTASSGLNTAPVVVTAGASPQTANGRSGQVTFSGVSIAAGATQSFVINNTSIAAIGTVILYSMVGATTGAALNIQSVTNVAGTSSTIVVENGTGATTSTANITFTFLVLN